MKLVLGTQIIIASILLSSFILSYLMLYKGWLARFRFQREPTPVGMLMKHVPLIILNYVILPALSSAALFAAEPWFEMNEYPSLGVLLVQVMFILAADDAWFYFSHRLLHRSRFLMKNIHRKHHEVTAPIPLDYLYVHPLDWPFCSVGIVIGVSLVVLVFGEVNIWPWWAYSAIRGVNEVILHSGLKFSFMRKIPFRGSAEYHDLHHSRPVGNYSSTLKIWDKAMATEIE